MRVYMITDLEGVCGVFRWEQANEYGSPANIEARHLLMGEVNAAVAGAFEGGATRVVVRDGHNGAKSFFLEQLDTRAEAIMGRMSRYDDVLKEGFDVGILLGYHSMSHTPGGVLCHTQSSATWDNYWINGRSAGEIAQMAVLLGSHDVPVVMVTGDDKTCAEARDWLGPDVAAVEVKRGLTREGACMVAPAKARQLITEATRESVGNPRGVKPLKPGFPLTVRWRFKDSGIVDGYRGEARRVDAQTLEKQVDEPADLLSP